MNRRNFLSASAASVLTGCASESDTAPSTASARATGASATEPTSLYDFAWAPLSLAHLQFDPTGSLVAIDRVVPIYRLLLGLSGHIALVRENTFNAYVRQHNECIRTGRQPPWIEVTPTNFRFPWHWGNHTSLPVYTSALDNLRKEYADDLIRFLDVNMVRWSFTSAISALTTPVNLETFGGTRLATADSSSHYAVDVVVFVTDETCAHAPSHPHAMFPTTILTREPVPPSLGPPKIEDSVVLRIWNVGPVPVVFAYTYQNRIVFSGETADGAIVHAVDTGEFDGYMNIAANSVETIVCPGPPHGVNEPGAIHGYLLSTDPGARRARRMSLGPDILFESLTMWVT